VQLTRIEIYKAQSGELQRQLLQLQVQFLNLIGKRAQLDHEKDVTFPATNLFHDIAGKLVLY